MAGIFNVISKLFGNKYDKDIKKIRPTLDLIHQEHQKISVLNNDELREQTLILKKKINDYVSSERDEIKVLKEHSNLESTKVKEKELNFEKIDSLEKDIIKKIEEVLNNILPTAFAIIKETAQRFKENTEIKVKASEYDVFLA